ncbi:16190_t:CDS:2 [Dentiscutata erythropus]|uniref:16190_t:CDS:1 n=1 Tax=Dentiscutata erythropus TaxID=1348616 RepID=A0A9N9BGX0_9GLOM|nr:16190_t:CDS:2 [Dentiscutata erythropus]
MPVNTSKELLDFEDCHETIIEKKIAGLLKKTGSKSLNKRNRKQKSEKSDKLETFPLAPPTDLYSRINEFLPQIASENEEKQSSNTEQIKKSDKNLLKTFPLKPPTNLFSRVTEFLPRIASKNEQLAKEDPTRINIEHIEEDTEYVIEWDLGVGVFEHQKEFSEDDIIICSSSKPKEITYEPIL